MARRRWRGCAGVMLGVAMGIATGAMPACAGVAQDSGDAPSRNLTVWIVRPATAADHAVQRAQNDLRDISVYHESTSGDFGKSASEAGQTSGSYGKPASEIGSNASAVGTNAGDYGQTSSSLPSNVLSQTAGSYGQTSGSFGSSASDFSGAPRPGAETESTASRDTRGVRWTNALRGLEQADSLQVRVVEVNALDLRARLQAALRTPAFPDVLVSDRMPDWWPAAMADSTVLRLAHADRIMAFPGETTPAVEHRDVSNPYREAYGLVNAPHPEATREFLEWWYARESFSGVAGKQPERPLPAAVVAREAVLTVLNGGGVDTLADAAMAKFNPSLTRAVALGLAPEDVPPDMRVDAAVLDVRAGKGLAVVRLHAVAVSRKAFGQLFPLVLLRADPQGRWRVLQLSLEMSARDAADAFAALLPYTAPGAKETAVATPVLASPLNGDQRTARNGLRVAWDESADDGLMLVEWQRGSSGKMPASAVLLVSDANARAQTEVGAPFADVTGPVRWRVWALGHGGVVRLSDWRTVEMAR